MLISKKELAGICRRTVLAPIEAGLEYLCMECSQDYKGGGSGDDQTTVLSNEDDETFTTSPTKSTYTMSTMMRKGSYDHSGSFSGTWTRTNDTTTCGSKSTYSESMMKENTKKDDDDDETITCGTKNPSVIKMNQCKNDEACDTVLEKFYEKNSIMESSPSKKRRPVLTSAPKSPRTIGGESLIDEHREAWNKVVEDIQMTVQDFGLYAEQVGQVFKEGKCLKRIPTRSQRLKYNCRSTFATTSTAKAVLVDVSNGKNQDVSMITCPTWPSKAADDETMSRYSATKIVGYADDYNSMMDGIDEYRSYEPYEEEEEEEEQQRDGYHHHHHHLSLPGVCLKLMDRFDASTIATDENIIVVRKTKINELRATKLEEEGMVDHRDDTENMITIMEDWRKTKLEPSRKKPPAVVVTTAGVEKTSTTPLFSAVDNNNHYHHQNQTTFMRPPRPGGMVLYRPHLQLDVPYNTAALENALSSGGRAGKNKNNGNSGGGGSRRNRLLKTIRLRRLKVAASNVLSGGKKKKNDVYQPLLSDEPSFDQSYSHLVWPRFQ